MTLRQIALASLGLAGTMALLALALAGAALLYAAGVTGYGLERLRARLA